MSKEAFLLGYPVEFKRLCLVYPPKLKDVVTNPAYHLYNRVLTYSQEEVEDEFVKANLDLKNLLTPFEYLLNGAYNNSKMKEIIEQAFFFYIHEPVTFLYDTKQILIGDIKEVKSIKELRQMGEEDFFDFQNLIRQASGQDAVEPPNPHENPRIKAIKAKARYRDKIKAKSKSNLKLETILSSIWCMNIGINPLNSGELSYAAIPVIMDRYQEKEKYDLDIRSLLAGADSKKVKPKYWIRNLDN